jgi:hypothetical protein
MLGIIMCVYININIGSEYLQCISSSCPGRNIVVAVDPSEDVEEETITVSTIRHRTTGYSTKRKETNPGTYKNTLSRGTSVTCNHCFGEERRI